MRWYIKWTVISVLSVVTGILLFYSISLLTETVETSVKAKTELPVIIIDAGHGGFDGGAQGADGTLEKDINLAVSLKTEAALKKLGFQTVMVRTTDTAVNTVKGSTREEKRSDILYRHSLMDKYPNSIYLCIHQNHFGQTGVHGAQVFYSQNDQVSKILAQHLQNAIKDGLQTDNNRVIKPIADNVYIVSNAVVPAVLIECGFLSNQSDLYNLKSKDYQNKLSDIIASAVSEFVSEQGG